MSLTFADDCCYLILDIVCHWYVGSMCWTSHLQGAWYCASSPDNHFKSYLMLSIHLRFGVSFLLLPCTSITITLLPTYILLLLLHVCTTLTYFPELSWIFIPLSLSINLSFVIQDSYMWLHTSTLCTFCMCIFPFAFSQLNSYTGYIFWATFCIRSTIATFSGGVATFCIGSISVNYILRHSYILW